MADHMHKKYIGKVEKTVYIVESVEIIAPTEREAEEILDEYVWDGAGFSPAKLIETEIQEETVSNQWIEESEALGVDEFMKIDGGQTLERQ